MNIFVLDQDPYVAARYHCDKHVVKMVLETAQMLSTITGHGYRPTHLNHPCTVWARQSTGNFQWLYDLGLALGKEYTHRYRKRHKSSFVIAEQWPPPETIPAGPLTPFALAMPEQYKCDCPVQSYRAYYVGDKAGILSYKNRAEPYWLQSWREHGTLNLPAWAQQEEIA